jgi:hypothetical protein
MAMGTPVPAPEPARDWAGSAVDHWAAKRLRYVDNLKVILIAAIIAGHAVASYVDEELWPYAEMREVTFTEVTSTLVLMAVVPFGLLMVPLLFLVAGLLTPASLERKGPGPYARDRLLRLGVPFALVVLLLWPLLMYPVHPPGEAPDSYWVEFFGGTGQHAVDAGVLWFVGVLLIFSLGYAGVARMGHGHAERFRWREISVAHLWGLAAAVALASFVVRLAIPYDGDEYGIDLNVYEWPACLAMFVLGIAATRQGWLTTVPDRVRRQSRTATLGAVAAFAVFVAVADPLGVVEDELWGGWHWPAVLFATLESVLTVFGPVWLLAVAQRRLERPFRWAGSAVSRSAYGAFLLQGLPLIGLAMVLRPVPVPAEVKAVALAAGAVVASFGLAWVLISRVPGLGRFL